MRQIIACLCGLLAASQLSAARFELTADNLQPAPGVTETTWQARVGRGEFDRIGLHRYGPAADVDVTAFLLYLPGTNMNGTSAVPDEDHNLFLFLASRGVVVYALDYRTHVVPHDHEGSRKFMRRWTLDAFVDDADAALEFAARREQDKPAFVAGFSRGVSIGYGLLNVTRVDVAGFVALDGSFKHYAPVGSFDRRSAIARLAESGRWASAVSRSRSWQSRHELMQGVYTNPAGPAPDGRSANIGEQLSNTLYRAWGPGALANPRDGISDVTVLARLLDSYDWFYPTVQNVDGRGIAMQEDDPSTKLDDRWGKLTPAVIYFGAANFGTESLLSGIYSASHAGSKDVTIHVLENHGHLDVIVGNRARQDVFEPTLLWITQRAGGE